MSERIDLVYERLVADENLKSGTKYERLAAIAFRMITERETVHDLRLVGSSDVAHQIDAVVGDMHRRVLIEAKDYDKPVGLGIVRDFWGVVDDIAPDEAFIVTTHRFTAPAMKFAAAKGIKLAVLRPPREEDWEGFIRSVHGELRMTAQAGLASVQWHLHPDDHHKLKGEATPRRTVSTDSLALADANGVLAPFYPGFKAEFGEEYGKVPLGGQATIGRATTFDEPTWLHESAPSHYG